MMIRGAQGPAASPIGSRMRLRRKELKLTLQEVAQRSGLSAAFISQAERNLAVPSIVSLLKLARVLQVDLNYFVQLPHGSQCVVRAGSRQRIRLDSPVQYFQLSAGLPEQRMDGILMRIPPGHVFPVDQREGEDFLYLVKGRLRATVGEVDTVLTAGDSMHFDSRLPHSARNESRAEAILLYVGTPSIFKDDQR